MRSRTVTIIVAVVLAGVLAAGTAGAAIIVAPPNTSDGRTYSLIDNVFGGNPPEYVEAATGSVGFDTNGGGNHWGTTRTWSNGATTTATWSYSGLASGTYDVYASWRNTAQGNLGTAQYAVSDGGGTVTRDQIPGTASYAGNVTLMEGTEPVVFAPLGQATVSDGTLDITVTKAGGNFLFFDATAVAAVPLIANASFEAPVLAPETWGTPAGWSVTGGSMGHLNGFAAQGLQPRPDGTAQNAWSNNGDIYQALSADIQPNTTYTLTVDVGDRNDLGFPAGTEVRLGSGPTFGSNLLPFTSEDRPFPPNGGWETWTATFDSGPSPVAGPLRVELVNPGGTQPQFDNVRLTDAPTVPVPPNTPRDVFVRNPSFEANGTPGPPGYASGAPAFWERTGGTDSGWMSTHRPELEPRPDGTDNHAWSNGPDIFQTTNEIIAADTLYTLTVDVGARSDVGVPAGTALRLGGGNVFGANMLTLQDVVDPNPSPGSWETWSVTSLVEGANPFIGQPLRIELFNGGVAQPQFDNVRLEAISGYVPPASPIIADYRDDYNGVVMPPGWQYLWNAPSDWDGSSATDGSTGPITSLADYELLQSTGTDWRVDGDTDPHNGHPGRYLRLSATSGHPGRGQNQSESPPLTVANAHDRYAIAAYTIQPGDLDQNGPTLGITDSLLQTSGGGAVEVRVHVNDDPPILTKVIPGGGTIGNFNVTIPNPQVGDTIYVSLGPNLHDGSDTFQLDFSLANNIVACFQGDFQGGTMPDGWKYMWNAPSDWDGSSSSDGTTGPITSIADFELLQWSSNGSMWTADGDDDPGNGAPANYLRLLGTGGHPGRGSSQAQGIGNDLERYVIAAFAVPYGGDYRIADSYFDTLGQQGDGGDIRVFTDTATLLDMEFPPGTGSFDVSLGYLRRGQYVYIALGPNGHDGNDNFSWDFQIVADRFDIPEPASLALLGAGLLALRRRRKA